MRRLSGIVTIAVSLLLGTQGGSFASESADPYATKADGYSMPATFAPKDFFSLSRLFIQPGNTLWLAENYEVSELERASIEGKEWVRWNFIKKTDAFIPSLAYAYPSRIAPAQFSIRVLNRGRIPVALSGWGETNVQQFQTILPAEERLVTLQGRPTLVMQCTRADVEYDLLLRDLTINYPEAEGLTVRILEVPRQITARKSVQIRLGIQGDLGSKALEIEVRRDPWVIWRIPLSPEETGQLHAQNQCVIERQVPWYLSPREVTFGLTTEGRRIRGAEPQALVINKHQPGFPRTERRLHNGRPAFFLNGKPFTWSGYATYFNFSPATIKEFANSGANLFHITCAPGRHYHNVAAPTWLGDDDYDFGEIEQWATTILQANPEAKLVMRLALGLPPFWFAKHPESLARVQTTDGREMVWLETESMVASLTSEEWRRQQALVLRKLIRYCASRPWASQVVGFNLGGGMTEEWFAWASCDEIVKPVKVFSDYSPANQRAFREWCAVKGYPYRQIPGPDLRKRPGHDLFADDERGRWAAAYNLFINQKTAEALMYFAAVVKNETRRRSLVGAFFGYVVLLTGEARQSDSGQFGVRQVLDCKDIDYLSGVPQHYLRRLCGDGYAGQPTAIESVLAHDKQYVDDNDLFSWLHEAHWHVEYDPKDPRRGAIEMHRRWQASEAVRGNSYEWFSLSPKWHRDDGIMAEFALEARIHAQALKLDRTPTEEIAFVIDDHSFSWLTPEARAHYANQVLMGSLGRTGAPIGVWLLSDLDRLPSRIKFVVVVNASAPRAKDLKKLKQLIERGGRTILVVGVPGLVDEKTQRWNLAGLQALLGLPIQLEVESKSGAASLVETGEWICPMQPKVDFVGPRAHSTEDGFMKYEDGKTAGAERPLASGGKLIWCGVPPFASEAWLRKQVQEAGVHCYAPPSCSVHASRDLVAITSVYSDDRDVELCWPEEVVITDLYDGWQGKGKTTCPFEHGQTRLFKVSRK